jgi:1,4-dihydroxy-2-naphthoate octaprenyltransferase
MKNFILAARPKTLLAGVLPPTVSYVYYRSLSPEPALVWYILCLVGALAIQLATNFFNDVIDHERGADRERVGPTRVSASGLVDVATVRRWAWAMVAIALACGVPIIWRGGWPFVVLGLCSLYLTYGYTGGKAQLAYRGLGELFVFLFFGLFAVLGSFYLYAQRLGPGALLLGVAFGLLATTLIGINNLRDRHTDRKVGKRTLATRMPPSQYRAFITATIFTPYLTLPFLIRPTMLLLMCLGLIPALKLVLITYKEEGAALNDGLKFAGIHLLVFSLLLSLALAYGHLL